MYARSFAACREADVRAFEAAREKCCELGNLEVEYLASRQLAKELGDHETSELKEAHEKSCLEALHAEIDAIEQAM